MVKIKMNHPVSVFLVAFMVLCCSLTALLASDSTTEVSDSPIHWIATEDSDLLLNEGWDYYATALRDPSALDRRDGSIRVDLPHTWNATDPTDSQPGYRRDASWYRKLLQLAPDAALNYADYYYLEALLRCKSPGN